jgi:2-oxo-4-hydroxy-4-carboxy-5-ureidoimidazoline decarboxylase
MNEVLGRWNDLVAEQAAGEILACCGSCAWARGMAARRPIADEGALLAASDRVWRELTECDWLEAFRSHPRIGEWQAAQPVAAQTAAWSGEEQRQISAADEETKMRLAEGNRAYEKRFGRIFLVCATGKSLAELLETLERRLHHDDATELHEAAEQQRQIAQLRLKKWLRS